MFLFADGLNEGWENGKVTYWENGKVTYWEMEALEYVSPEGMSFAEQRLNRDLSREPDILDESELNSDDYNFIHLATRNGRRYLNKLPLKVFRKLLANHFDIRFKQRTLKWPRRVKKLPRF